MRWVRFGAVIDVNERQLPAPLDHLRYLEEQGRVTAIEGGTAEVVPRPGCLDPEGRYWRLCLPGPAVKVDIFVLDDARWGLGFLVRTGSAEFSQAMLARWEARSGGGFSHGLQLTGAVGIVRRLPQAGSGDVRWSRWLRRGSRWSSPSRRLCSPMMAWSTPDSRAVQPDDGAGTLG